MKNAVKTRAQVYKRARRTDQQAPTNHCSLRPFDNEIDATAAAEVDILLTRHCAARLTTLSLFERQNPSKV